MKLGYKFFGGDLAGRETYHDVYGIAIFSESDVTKLQFGYSSYNLNIGPIIGSLYSGTQFVYNIISFVDKILSVKILFDEEKIDEDSKRLIPQIS